MRCYNFFIVEIIVERCKFDTDCTDVKIENYYHHDGEQLLFNKIVHIKTQSKKKDVLVIFILLQEMKLPIYLIKTVLKRTSNMRYSTWRKLTKLNRNWTGKIQVTLLSAYISWKKLCLHTFKTSSKEVMLMHSEKIMASFFRKVAG